MQLQQQSTSSSSGGGNGGSGVPPPSTLGSTSTTTTTSSSPSSSPSGLQTNSVFVCLFLVSLAPHWKHFSVVLNCCFWQYRRHIIVEWKALWDSSQTSAVLRTLPLELPRKKGHCQFWKVKIIWLVSDHAWIASVATAGAPAPSVSPGASSSSWNPSLTANAAENSKPRHHTNLPYHSVPASQDQAHGKVRSLRVPER